VLDIEMRPGIHIYAPGAVGYTGYSFTLEPDPAVRVIHDMQRPPAEMLELPSIRERLPINQGKIRISRDITISLAHEVIEHAEIELHGSFAYQACAGDFCYVPAKIPLKWVLEVGEHDLVRVPKSMRIKR